jgi:hypothetical protein
MSSKCSGSDLNYNRLLEYDTTFFHDADEVRELSNSIVSKQGFSKIGSSGAWYFDVPPRFKGNRVRIIFNIYSYFFNVFYK